jgi:hypothetical protein
VIKLSYSDTYLQEAIQIIGKLETSKIDEMVKSLKGVGLMVAGCSF